MKRREFIHILRRENPQAKQYSVYQAIVISLFCILFILFLFLQFSSILSPCGGLILDGILIVLFAIPLIIMDVQNDWQIKKLREQYQREGQLGQYRNRTTCLKIFLILEIIFILAMAVYSVLQISSARQEEDIDVTTPKGTIIETSYHDVGDFSIKIPTDFQVMSDEAIAIKYPMGNPPTLVYSNDTGSINLAFVLNDVAIKNHEIESFVMAMEELYLDYADSVKTNFFEKDGHKIGEMSFVTPAVDTKVYNHLMIFSVGGSLRIVNFNCTEKYVEEWEEVGDFIAQSIRFY